MPRSVDIYADARLNTAKAERQLRRFIKRAEANKINLSINERKFTQPLGRITGAANEFTKSLQASNARVLAFGASAGVLYGVASAMRFMSDKTIEVEHHLAQVNVILNASSKNLKKFGDRLFKIAGDTGQSFDEVAKAATEFSRQGLGMEQTLKRTSSAMILMRLSGLNAKEAVESLTAAVNSFSKESINHVAIVNKMAKVDAAFAVSTSDLAQAIRRVGSTAEDAGVGIDKLFAAVTSLQQTTARGGAVIGNSLKTIFTRVKRTAVIEQMRSLGIATKDASGQMRPAMAVLKDFAKEFDNLSASEKAHTAELMGGVFQMNMLRGLLKDLKKDTSIYAQALKMSTAATDEAIERNAELNKTLKALLNESLQQLTKVGVAIGQMTLEPFFRTLMTEFNKLTSGEGLFAGLAKGVAGAIGDGLNMVGLKDSKHTGAEMGEKLGKGILEGIGRFISGPGVMLFTAVIYRLTLTFTKFLASSGRDFLNLNAQSKNQLALQEQIAGVLSTHPNLIKRIEQGNLTVKQAETAVLQILKAQRQERERMAYLSGGVAGRAMKGGSMFVHKDHTAGTAQLRGRVRAQGHVPNFSHPTPKEKMGEVMAAREGGYNISPSDVVKKKFPGMAQPLVFNKLENLDMLAYGKPLISPPQGTSAARGHVSEINRKLGSGFNPYAGDGFIPNFFPRPNLKTAFGRRQAKGRGKVDFRTVPHSLIAKMQEHTGPFQVKYMSRGGYGNKAEIKTTTGVHFRESGYKGTGKGFPGGGSPSKDHKMLMMMTEKGPRGIPMEGIRAWRPSGQRNWNKREPGAAGGFVPNFAVSTAGLEAQRRYAASMGIHHTAGRGGTYAATGGASSLDKLMREFIKEAQSKNWVNVGRTGVSAIAAADRAAASGLITKAQANRFAEQLDLVKKNKGALTGTALVRSQNKQTTADKKIAAQLETDYWMLSSETGVTAGSAPIHQHAGIMWGHKVAGWKKQGAGDTGFQPLLEKELTPAFKNIYQKMFGGLGIGAKPPEGLKGLSKYAPTESIAGSLFDGFIKHAITRSPKTKNDVSKHVMDVQNMQNVALNKLFGLKDVRAGSKGDLKLNREGAGPGFAAQILDDLVVQFRSGGIVGVKNRITKHPFGEGREANKNLQNALSQASRGRIPKHGRKRKGKAGGYVPNFAPMAPMGAGLYTRNFRKPSTEKQGLFGRMWGGIKGLPSKAWQGFQKHDQAGTFGVMGKNLPAGMLGTAQMKQMGQILKNKDLKPLEKGKQIKAIWDSLSQAQKHGMIIASFGVASPIPIIPSLVAHGGVEVTYLMKKLLGKQVQPWMGGQQGGASGLTYKAQGHVPNFSAEADAFKREKKATGLPMSQIYSTFVGGRKVVGNLRDEPTRGALIKNIKNHPYPALAGSEFAAGGFVPSFAPLSGRAPHPLGGPMGGAGTYSALTYAAMQHSAIQRRGVRTVGPRGGVSFPKHAEGPALKTIQQLSAHLTAMGKAGTGASIHTKELSRALRLHVKQFRESHLSLETSLRSASRAALNFKEPIGVLQAQITAAGKSAGVADKHLASLQQRIWAAGQVAQQKAATWAKGGGTPYGPMMSGGRGQVGRALAAAPGQWMGATTTSAAYTAATGQKATAANMARANAVGLHGRIAASLPAPVLTDSVKPAALRMINTHLQKMEQSLRRGGSLTHKMVDSLNSQMLKYKVIDGDQQAIIKYMDQRQAHYQAIVTEEKKKIALVRAENQAIQKQIAARTFTPINPLAPATGKGGAASAFGTAGGGLVGAVGRSVAGIDKKVSKAKSQKRIQQAMLAAGIKPQSFQTVQGAYGGGKMTHSQLGRAYGGIINPGQGGAIAGKPMMLQGHLISGQAAKTAKHHALSNVQLTKINAEYGKIHAAMARGAPLTMEMQFAFQRILHKLGIEEVTQTQIINAMQGQAAAMQGIVAEETQQLNLEKQQTREEKKQRIKQAKIDAVTKAELLAKEGILANLKARLAAMRKQGVGGFFAGSGMGQLNTMMAGGGKQATAARQAKQNIKDAKSGKMMGHAMMLSMMAPMITSSIAQFETDRVKKARMEGYGDVAMMGMMGSMFGGAGLAGGLAVGTLMGGNKVFRALIDNSEALGMELELAKEKLTNFNDGVQKLTATTERYQTGLLSEDITAGELSLRKQLQMDAFAQIPDEFRSQIVGVQGDQDRMQTTLEAIRKNTADMVKMQELRNYQEKLTSESRSLTDTLLGGKKGGEGWVTALLGGDSIGQAVLKEAAIFAGLSALTYFTGGGAGAALVARVGTWGAKGKKAHKAISKARATTQYGKRMAAGIGPAGVGRRALLTAGIGVGGTMGGLWGDGKMPEIAGHLWNDDKAALVAAARSAQGQVFDDTDRGKMALTKIGDMYKDILDMPTFFAEESFKTIEDALAKLKKIDPNNINLFIETLRKDFGLNEKAIIELEDFLKSRAAGEGLKDVPKLIKRLMGDLQKGLDIKKELRIFNETIAKQKELGIKMRENAKSYADAIRAVDIELTSAVSVMQESVLRGGALLSNADEARRSKLLGTANTRLKTNEPFLTTGQKASFGTQVSLADSRSKFISELSKTSQKNQQGLLNLFSSKLDSVNKTLVKEYQSLEMKGEGAKEIRRKKMDISGQRDALSEAFTDVSNIFARDRNAGAESIAGVLYKLVDDPAFANQQTLLQQLIAEVRVEGEKNVTKLAELIQTNKTQEDTLKMQRKLQQEQINLQKRLGLFGGAKAFGNNETVADSLMKHSKGVMAAQFAKTDMFGFDSGTLEKGRSAFNFLKLFKNQTQLDIGSIVRGSGGKGGAWGGDMGALVNQAIEGAAYRLEREASTMDTYMRDVLGINMGGKEQLTQQGDQTDWTGIAREQIAAELEMGDIAGNVFKIREGIAQFNKLASLNETNFQDKNKEAFKQAMKEVALVEAIDGTTGEVSQFGGYNIGKLNEIIKLLDTQNAIREIGENLSVKAREEKDLIGLEGGLRAGLPALKRAMEEAQGVADSTRKTAEKIINKIIQKPDKVDQATWDKAFTEDKRSTLTRQIEQLGQFELKRQTAKKQVEELRAAILGPTGLPDRYAKLEGDEKKEADVTLMTNRAWAPVTEQLTIIQGVITDQEKRISETIDAIARDIHKTRYQGAFNLDPSKLAKVLPFPGAPKDYFEHQTAIKAKGSGKGYGNIIPGDNTLIQQAQAQGAKMGIKISPRSLMPIDGTSDALKKQYRESPVGSKAWELMQQMVANRQAMKGGETANEMKNAFGMKGTLTNPIDRRRTYMLQMARAAHFRATPFAEKFGPKATETGIALSRGMGYTDPKGKGMKSGDAKTKNWIPDFYEPTFMKNKKISPMVLLQKVEELQEKFIKPRLTGKIEGQDKLIHEFKDTIGNLSDRLRKSIGPTGEITSQTELEKLFDDIRSTFREAVRYEHKAATSKGTGLAGFWRSGGSESSFIESILSGDVSNKGPTSKWMEARPDQFKAHSRFDLAAVVNAFGIGSAKNTKNFQAMRDTKWKDTHDLQNVISKAGLDFSKVSAEDKAKLAAEDSAVSFAKEAKKTHEEAAEALKEAAQNLGEATTARKNLEEKLAKARSRDSQRMREKLRSNDGTLNEYASPFALRGKGIASAGRTPLGYNKEAIQHAQIFGKKIQLGKKYLDTAGIGSQHLSGALDPIRGKLENVMDEGFSLAHGDTQRMVEVLNLVNEQIKTQTEAYTHKMSEVKNAIDGEPGEAGIYAQEANNIFNKQIVPLQALSNSIQALVRLQTSPKQNWSALMGPQMRLASSLLKPGMNDQDRGNTLDRMRNARIEELRTEHKYDKNQAVADEKIIKKKLNASKKFKDAEIGAAQAKGWAGNRALTLLHAREAKREWLADPKNIINPIVQPGAPGGQQPDIDAVDPFAVPRPEGRGGPHTSTSRREALAAGANLRREIALDDLNAKIKQAEEEKDAAEFDLKKKEEAKAKAASNLAETNKLKISGRSGEFASVMENDPILKQISGARDAMSGENYKASVVKWQDKQANESARLALKDLEGDYETAALSTRAFGEELVEIGKKITESKIMTQDYGMEDWIRGIREEMTYTTNNLKADLDELGRSGINKLRTGFADVFYNALDGTKSLREGFKDLFDEVGNMITKAIIQMAVNQFIFAPAGINTGARGGSVTGGKIRKYARGGEVLGGSGTRDDVPAMLNSGEFVIRKSSVNKYGLGFLDNLNRGHISGFASGGDPQSGLRSRRTLGHNYTESVLRNAFIYDDDKMPTLEGSGFEIDNRLSRFALSDENNPQNAFRMNKQGQLYDYHKQVLDEEKSWEETLRQWRADKKARLRKAWTSAALSMALGSGLDEPYWNKNIKQNYGYKMGRGVMGIPGRLGRGMAGGARQAAAWWRGNGQPNAQGGLQTGTDKIAALLTGGEYVVSREAVSKHGRSFFEKLNEGSLPKYEKGGYVGGEPSVGGNFNNGPKEISNNVNITVNIDSEGQSSESGTLNDYEENRDRGNNLGAVIKDVVVKTIIDQTRQGGILAPINRIS